MKINSMNRHTCSTCGNDGQLIKCHSCPRAFHSKCLLTNESSKCREGRWQCSHCSTDQPEIYLYQNNNGLWYKYLRMFDAGSLEDNGYEAVPSVGMLLLALEWILLHDLLPAVAACVCKYFLDNRRFQGVDLEKMTNLFTERSYDPISYANLIEQLRSIVDVVSLDEILAKLSNNMDASAIGLASSHRMFFQLCPDCKICRYLRSFCFNCGHIFDVSVDLDSDLAYIIANSHPLSELAVQMGLERSSIIDSDTLLEGSIRGTSTNSTTLDNLMQEKSDDFPTASKDALRSVPLIIPSNSGRKRDRVRQDQSVKKGERDSNYSNVAFRAITQLSSLGRQQRDGFEVHGGDMLFLTRNLATNCTGLHRIYSRRVFAEMCNRWVQSNPGLSALQGGENDVHCIVEVLVTLTQLVDSRTRSYMMYSEPEPHGTEERLSHIITAGFDCLSTVVSGRDSFGRNLKFRRTSGLLASVSSSSSSSSRSSLSGGKGDFVIASANRARPHCVSTTHKAEDSVLVDLSGDSDETATPRSVMKSIAITPAKITMKPRGIKTNTHTLSTGTISDVISNSSSDIQVGCESKIKPSSVAPSSDSASSCGSDVNSTSNTFEFVRDRKRPAPVASRPQLTRRAKERVAVRLSEELQVDLLTGAAVQHPELFDYRIFLDNYREALPDPSQCNSLMELICFDPKAEQVPLTPISHCTNCSATNKPSTTYAYKNKKRGARNTNSTDTSTEKEIRKNCRSCGNEFASVVDFSALTDTLCWAYLFKCIGLDVDLHTPHADSLPKIIRLLPTVRTYSTLRELGEDFYKWQCYFITHLIYAFSDYGQHALRRQLFAEEFEFMATQMIIIIVQLRDPEIVGEFIHCLKILQYTEESDPQLAVIIRYGMDFLVQTEHELGEVGLFVPQNAEFKDRYHASYCGAVGLLDSPFSENVVDRLSPPVPRLLSFI